jgi:hypothetical protein
MIQKDMNTFAGKVVLIKRWNLWNWPGDSDCFYRAPTMFSSRIRMISATVVYSILSCGPPGRSFQILLLPM